MSGSVEPVVESGSGFAEVLSSRIGSDLTELLLAEAIVPGSAPSYQLCKKIYTSHPLGGRIAEQPIGMAQSKGRTIEIPGGPQERLAHAFRSAAAHLGGPGISEDYIVRTLHTLKRVYGIASIVILDRDGKLKPEDPLRLQDIPKLNLVFNILDPLNTAGSLVLSQDPNSPDFQRTGTISIAGTAYHPSRTLVVLNEQPIYIDFTYSAFGFVGRSIYQRPLFPLKTFVQTMITDDYVARKVGLLIAKMKSPGSILTRRMMNLFGLRIGRLKAGITGNVLTIGHEDNIESLSFRNLKEAGEFARSNCIRNIGSAVRMPAKMLDQETLTEGFGEGKEDAEQIVKYVDGIRTDLNPTYATLDMIVQRKAWTPEFYEGIVKDFPNQYEGVPYETAFYQWRNSFVALWPNLREESDSEKVRVDETRFKSVVALVEVLSPLLDEDNQVEVIKWAADQVNARKDLFASPLLFDEEKLKVHSVKKRKQEDATAGEEQKEPQPTPFSERT